MFSHFSRYHEKICKCMIAFSPKRAHPWKHLHWNLNLPAPMLPRGQWIGKETPGATMDPNSHDGTLAEWIWNRVKISNSGMSVLKAHQANDLEYSPKQSCLLLLFPTAPAPLPFLFSFFYWRLIILQYCSGFWHILTWISRGFTCVPDPEPPSYLPPHPIPQCTGFEYPVSCIKLGLVLYFTYGNIHVSMLFSQIIPLSPSPRVQKSIFISVSLLLSYI